jgi:MFS family permease
VSFFGAAITGRLSERFPARVLLFVGLGLAGLGLVLMRAVTPSSSWTVFLPGFVLGGAGVGMVNPVLAATAIGVVSPQRSGMAAGINNTFRQVGTAAGIAALGAIFQSSLTRHLTSELARTPAAGRVAEISRAVTAGGAQQVIRAVPHAERARASLAIHVAFTAALNDLLLVGGVVAFVGAGLALLLVRRRDFVTYGEPERTGQEPAAVATPG